MWENIRHDWNEKGIVGVLEFLEGEAQNLPAGTLRRWLCLLSLNFIQLTANWFSPQLMWPSEERLASFIQTSQWNDSQTRAMSWHPHLMKIAVAAKNDIVRVFSVGSDNSDLLKHQLQKSISCLAWRPQCGNELAVGCLSGILLWKLDPNITRHSLNAVRFLSVPGHAPIVSFTWSPFGKYLASSSSSDNAIQVWEISREMATPVSRLGGGRGVPFISWSPHGTHLFSATSSTLFRVWETRKWTCERWSSMSNQCKCACWSSDGRTLVFAVHEDASLYCLQLVSSGGNMVATGSSSCVKCVDLSPHTFGPGNIVVGGAVQSLAWDPTSQRLAVILTADSPGSELVIVCRTRVTPIVEIVPCGFIRGPAEFGLPSCMTFQNEISDGALLSVGWTQGNVSHIPLRFQSAHSGTASASLPQLQPHFFSEDT
eukprot:m.42625 g.42625  ORF g.42625 m.42625 type:complete len:428 (+) comp33373_c0_seq4:228-1511(+)